MRQIAKTNARKTNAGSTTSEQVLLKQNKMSAFRAQNPTQTYVWHGQKLTPHHIRNKKEEGSPDFLLF